MVIACIRSGGCLRFYDSTTPPAPGSSPRRGTTIMAKKRVPPAPPPSATEARASVTPDRFARLYLLLTVLAKSPQPRAALAKRLKLDVRGFYRDLEVLRLAGVSIELSKGKYYLRDTITAARERLPFPDPLLTVGEVTQLARGSGAAHKR